MNIGSRFVFERESEFIINIHKDRQNKLDELFQIIGDKFEDISSYEVLEHITNMIMKKVKKSDKNFLLWLHCVGCHVKFNFDAKWILLRVDKYIGENIHTYYHPAIMDKNTEVWEVGNSCYIQYYLKRRMHGISFLTFYKIHIERSIWKPKFHELNYSDDRLIVLS